MVPEFLQRSKSLPQLRSSWTTSINYATPTQWRLSPPARRGTFMDLPAELRLSIYSLAVDSDLPGVLVLSNHHSLVPRSGRSSPQHRWPVTLLLTSKVVWREAFEVLLSKCHVSILSQASSPVFNALTSAERTSIRRLTIEWKRKTNRDSLLECRWLRNLEHLHIIVYELFIDEIEDELEEAFEYGAYKLLQTLRISYPDLERERPKWHDVTGNLPSRRCDEYRSWRSRSRMFEESEKYFEGVLQRLVDARAQKAAI